jgi:hypothetical protein
MWEKRVAPLSGPVCVVLLLAGTVLTGNFQFMPPESDVVAFYSAAPLRIVVASYVGLLSSFFLIWFAGSVGQAIRPSREGQAGRHLTISVGGGIFAAAMLALAHVANSYAAERVMAHGSIDPGSATTFFDLSSGLIGTAAPIGLAAMIGGYGVARRAGGVSGWRTWLSLGIAVGLVSPINWIVLFPAIIWLVVMGVDMYRAGRLDGRLGASGQASGATRSDAGHGSST